MYLTASKKCWFSWNFVIFALLVLFSAQYSASPSTNVFSFTKSRYVISIAENVRGKEYATAQDPKMGVYLPEDSADENPVRYKIVSGDRQNFRAEAQVVGNFAFLRISTRPSLDLSINREFSAEYQLRIKGYLRRQNERANLETMAEVTVRILDQNDLAPLFSPDKYEATITFENLLHSSILQVTAIDPDEGINGQIYYSIKDRKNDYFSVNPHSGSVFQTKRIPMSEFSDPKIDSLTLNLEILAEDRAWRLFHDPTSTEIREPSLANVKITIKRPTFQNPTIRFTQDANLTRFCGLSKSRSLCGILELDWKNIGFLTNRQSTVKIIIDRHLKDQMENQLFDLKYIGHDRSVKFYELFSLGQLDNFGHQNITVEVEASGSHFKFFHNISLFVADQCQIFRSDSPISNMIHLKINSCWPNGVIIDFIGRNLSDLDQWSFSIIDDSSIAKNIFAISDNGLIKLANISDVEKPEMNFTILAQSQLCPNRTLTYRVSAKFLLCNKHPPVILNSSCSKFTITKLSYSENSPLCRIIAFDPDKIQDELLYTLLSNDIDVMNQFTLNHKTGELSLQRTGTMSEKLWSKSYNFDIKVSDHSLATIVKSHVTFNKVDTMPKGFNITPEVTYPQNLFTPKFTTVDKISINRTVKVGDRIFRVQAEDLDNGAAGDLRYFIVDGDDQKCFDLNSINGDLRISCDLDAPIFDDVTQFQILILAQDSGFYLKPKAAFQKLTINFSGAKMSNGKFSRRRFYFDIAENSPTGSMIGRLATRSDFDNVNGRQRFTLIGGNGIFDIDPKTGILNLDHQALLLDREKIDRYLLSAILTDDDWPDLKDFATIVINILDVNDNKPQRFSEIERKRWRIEEDLPNFTTVACLDAYDVDIGENSSIFYRLVDTNGEQSFGIDPDSGCVWINEKLNFEEKPLHNLSIEMSDRGLPSLSSTSFILIEVIDVKENQFLPEFDKFAYEASVYENEPEGTEVLKVQALDKNVKKDEQSRITYSITGGDGLGLFTIDPSGKIRTSRHLDRETKPFYWLTVLATDSSAKSLNSMTSSVSNQVEVFVRVLVRNDNRPVPLRPLFEGTLRENAPAGAIVGRIEATDLDEVDSAKLSFKIAQGDPQSFFKIDAETGFVSSDRRQVDRESVTDFELEITISDLGTPSLTSNVVLKIRVEDENDNPPKFLHRFNEHNVPAGDETTKNAFVCRILANDDDTAEVSPLIYNITEGNDDHRFRIVAHTGEIFVQGTPLKEKEIIALAISASDGKHTDRASVVINVLERPNPKNNAAPHLMKHNATVYASASDPIGRSIGLMEATDADGDTLFFYLSNGDGTFLLRVDSGDLQIASQPILPLYHLNYFVTDGIHNVSGKLTVIVQNLPEKEILFKHEHYSLTIFENVTIGTTLMDLEKEIVGALKSHPDIRYFVYNDFSANGRKFEIDTRKGTLFLTDQLDHEVTRNYSIHIEARSRKSKAFCLINIQVLDVNDHKPSFLARDYEFRLLDTIQIGSTVSKLEAYDQDSGDDGKLIFKLVGGNELSFFDIDESTGSISLLKPLTEAPSSEFVLFAKVEDSGQRPLADFTTVRLIISNNRRTVFKNRSYLFEIAETTFPGAVIGAVLADGVGKLVYSIPDDKSDVISISPTEGLLYLNSYLNYSNTKRLTFNVKCTDWSGKEDTVEVTVNVFPTNRHRPIFERTLYNGYVVENSPSSSLVYILKDSLKEGVPLKVRAKDSDQGPAGLVYYNVVKDRMEELFEVDHITGAVRTKVPLDYEKRKIYEIRILAEDGGNSVLHSLMPTIVRIEVVDVNDNPPVFDLPDQNINIDLPIFDSETITSLKAIDIDRSSILHFSLKSHQDSLRINSSTGDLIVKNQSLLNFNQPNNVEISVDDGLYETSATLRLNFHETRKQNHDNFHLICPEFNVDLAENDLNQRPLILLPVYGKNLEHTTVFYELKKSIWHDYFTIDRFIGLLSSTGLGIDRESLHSDIIHLTIIAKTNEKPPRKTSCKVGIKILDINDNAPTFLHQPYLLNLKSSLDSNQTKFKVQAIDLDSGQNGKVRFQFGKLGEKLIDVVSFLNLDSETGKVTLKKNVTDSAWLNKRFDLPIIALDNGEPSLNATTTLSITFVERQSIFFTKSIYEIELSENAPIGHYIMDVKITFIQSEPNSIGHFIQSGDPDSNFRLDFLTGKLTTQKKLDREKSAEFRILVRAVDFSIRHESINFIDALVWIKVTDINDNAPRFPKSFYKFSMSENMPAGTKVGQVFAFDPDISENSRLSYRIDDEAASKLFKISPKDGSILLRSSLDFEKLTFHAFNITASDYGSPKMESSVVVIIAVLDINDNPPMFTKLSYDSTIYRDAKIGSFVTQIFASDPDQLDRGRLYYDVIHQKSKSIDNNYYRLDRNDETNLFGIDRKTGVVQVENSLKKIKESRHILNISVSDGTHSSFCQLSIDLIEPSIQVYNVPKTYDFTTKEDVDIGTVIGNVNGKNQNSQEETLYTLLNENGLFKIDNFGNLITTGTLDAEIRNSYLLSVLARKMTTLNGFLDQTVPFEIKITVSNVNDNRPIFAGREIKLNLDPNFPLGATILHIFARDLDQNDRVEYTLRRKGTTSDIFKHFRIDKSNGRLDLIHQLSNSVGKTFRLIIVAADQGNPPLHDEMILEIFIDRSAEMFQFEKSIISMKIAENLNPGSTIGSLASILPANFVQKWNFRILNQENNKIPIDIDKSGSITLNRNGHFDRESISNLDFYVGVENLDEKMVAVALVHIAIDDVNDSAPKFDESKFSAAMLEDAPSGASVARLVARDLDSELFTKTRFSIVNENWKFKIDPETGWITVASKLDREVQELYRLTIMAQDANNANFTTEAVLEISILDINDEPPTFDFKLYEFSIDESGPLGSVVGNVLALDRDLSPYNATQYFLIEGNNEGFFGVNKGGSIYIELPLDIKIRKLYNLTLLATDGRFSSTTKVIITVISSENDTKFTCHDNIKSIEIAENATLGSKIFETSLSDRYFYIVGGDLFDLKNGSIKLINQQLDRESTEKYSIRIKSKEMNVNYCEQALDIFVLDVNDEKPNFLVPSSDVQNFQITENDPGPYPKFVAQFFAVDKDIGNNSQLNFKLTESTHFWVHEKSGALFALVPLDRETVDLFKFEIIAQDSGQLSQESRIQIKIDVLDLRDNAPQFEKDLLKLELYENVTQGSLLAVLKALSRDQGAEVDIRYSIEEEGVRSVFRLDEITGSLYTAIPLDRETRDRYDFAAVAFDQSQPSLRSRMQISIGVLDVNDLAPRFSAAQFHLSVSENVLIGSAISGGRLPAIDGDLGENRRLKYSLIEKVYNQGDGATPSFGVGDDATILVLKKLDFEVARHYELDLIAHDFGLPPLNGSTKVYIKILDVNDNAPFVKNCNRTINVKNNISSGSEIYILKVVDKDGPENGAPFVFEIFGKDSLHFTISDDGIVKYTKSEFTELHYDFKIIVKDSGKPPLSSECRLGIAVLEESRYAPELTGFHSTLLTYGGEFHGGIVGRVLATDRDAGDARRLTYDAFASPVSSQQNGLSGFSHDGELFAAGDDGRVTAVAGLTEQTYRLNVSAADGTFVSFSTATLEVKSITNEMMTSSLSVHLPDLDAQTFVRAKMHNFIRIVANSLGVRPQFIFLISVQDSNVMASTNAKNPASPKTFTEILLAAKKSRHEWHKPEHVRDRLATKLRQATLVDDGAGWLLMSETCRRDTCGANGHCRDSLHLLDDAEPVALLGGATNFVAPRHRRAPECLCYEGFGGIACDQIINPCSSRPCLNEKVCIPNDSISRGYQCSCPPGKSGTKCDQSCSNSLCSESTISFNGTGHVRHALWSTVSIDMDFSIQFKTGSQYGTLMSSSGSNDYQILEIYASFIQYRIDLGSGENQLVLKNRPINDNQWHTVRVIRHGKHLTLVLDERQRVNRTVQGAGSVLNTPSDFLYFGAEMTDDLGTNSRRHGERLTRSANFVGCLKNLELNGYRLRTIGAGVSLRNVAFTCSSQNKLSNPVATSHENQLICIDGNPCLNNGSCILSDFARKICKCLLGFTGQFCETSLAGFCKCQNGGSCVQKLEEKQQNCVCPAGFSGETCAIIDPNHTPKINDLCAKNPCANGGVCLSIGSMDFKCNCSSQSWTGKFCDTPANFNSFAPNNIVFQSSNLLDNWLEYVIMTACLLGILLFAICVVCLCRKRNRFRYTKGNYIQNVANDEITCDIMARPPSSRSSRAGGPPHRHPLAGPGVISVRPRFNDSTAGSAGGSSGGPPKPPPPLPPRLRSFASSGGPNGGPYRQNNFLLSNLESAKSSGIPTVQVRPLSMVEREATPTKNLHNQNCMDAAVDYGSAAEELERLGTCGDDDVDDDVIIGNRRAEMAQSLNGEDWKAALDNVQFNEESLERLKATVTSFNLPASRNLRRKTVDSFAQSVTSIQCLPEDEHNSSIYHWDYTDWTNTLAPLHPQSDAPPRPLARDYDSLARSELSIMNDGGASRDYDDVEAVGGALLDIDDDQDPDQDQDQDADQGQRQMADVEQFRQQLMALSRLNKNLGDDQGVPGCSDENGRKNTKQRSYLDRYLPKLNPPSSTGSERRHLLQNESPKKSSVKSKTDFLSDDSQHNRSFNQSLNSEDWSVDNGNNEESIDNQYSNNNNMSGSVAQVCEISDNETDGEEERNLSTTSKNIGAEKRSKV